MKPHIEALLSVDPRELTEAERAEIDEALAGEPDDLITAIAVLADRDLEELGDPLPRTPAIPLRGRRARRFGTIRRVAMAVVAAAVIAVAAWPVLGSDHTPERERPVRVELLSSLLEM